MGPRKKNNNNNIEILIAEDSATQAEELEHILEERGYRVTVAGNGKQALEAARKRKPTLIISDIMMPEMDGYAFCKAVKSDDNLKDTPVILVTTLSDPGDIVKGLECGADNFIRKPYDEKYLLSRIDYILMNRELRKTEKVQLGMEISLMGRRYFITSERQQILNLLISTYEQAVAINDELKARQKELAERTAQLESANKELESFSYSVSHDLRAPLRSIDGFSQALLDDSADRLDAQGRDHLQRVRTATRRMGELIDDLLALSRVTRSEMRRERMDLSALARTVSAGLRKAQPERQVEFVIAQGIVVDGDSGLLRAALENLLGNAWKFTAKHPRARIEFGVMQWENETAYFVRDDGAGFDMTYAGKLFGAFQRLHAVSEFEGTGIGLATVQRIINRHGGRLWAEGAVEKGATFYFTL
ncbi:MAG: response regulator [Nitrospirae bacterium]|nr:response regulator [Nitrospirota bacterium]